MRYKLSRQQAPIVVLLSSPAPLSSPLPHIPCCWWLLPILVLLLPQCSCRDALLGKLQRRKDRVSATFARRSGLRKCPTHAKDEVDDDGGEERDAKDGWAWESERRWLVPGPALVPSITSRLTKAGYQSRVSPGFRTATDFGDRKSVV